VRQELQAFMAQAPFQLPLEATPQQLSAGEKQKLEILKQLFLQPRLLVLDEPTSVLTPQEADEVLGALRQRAHAGLCTVVLITHKFREVQAFADDVSVLRRGHLAWSGAVADTSAPALAAHMVGGAVAAEGAEGASTAPGAAIGPAPSPARNTVARLQITGLCVAGDRGECAVDGLDLDVHAGEIVGVAGLMGAGRTERKIREGGGVLRLAIIRNRSMGNLRGECIENRLRFFGKARVLRGGMGRTPIPITGRMAPI
jgi:simple sugar transport system ATP-binding protein